MNDKRIQVAPFWCLDEFVDPYTYFNEVKNGLEKIDQSLFDIAQKVRDLHGYPIVINNWWNYYIENKDKLSCNEIIYNIENRKKLWWKGAYHNVRKWSGYRPPHCTIGAKKSAHKTGQAIDMVGNRRHLFTLVKDNAQAFYELGVRRLEDPSITPTWLHVDTKEHNTQPDSIRVVDLSVATEIIRW